MDCIYELHQKALKFFDEKKQELEKEEKKSFQKLLEDITEIINSYQNLSDSAKEMLTQGECKKLIFPLQQFFEKIQRKYIREQVERFRELNQKIQESLQES